MPATHAGIWKHPLPGKHCGRGELALRSQLGNFRVPTRNETFVTRMDTDAEGEHFVAKRIDFVQANSSPEALYVRFLGVLSAFISVHPWFQLSYWGLARKIRRISASLFACCRKGTHDGYPYRRDSMQIVGATLVVALACCMSASEILVLRGAEIQWERR